MKLNRENQPESTGSNPIGTEKFHEQVDQLFDLVFNESPSFKAITLGPSHVFRRVNQRYYEVLGLTSSILGRTVLEVFPEIENQGLLQHLDSVYQTGAAFHASEAPVALRREDGSERVLYVTFSYQPIRNASGEIYGLLHEGFDTTEAVLSRKILEKNKDVVENERQNFRNLFRQTPEMVCILRGPDHVFEFVNEAHVRALGFDATGMAVRVAQPESVEVHGILDSVYQTGVTAELHEIPVTLTDRLRYFNLTYAARRDNDGSIIGIMILGQEVTNEVLNREKLAQAVRARDDFLSIASHELKTPLTALRLQAQIVNHKILSGRQSSLDYERLSRFATSIDTQVDRLTNLVEDMLDISRIQNGKLTLSMQRGRLDSLVRNVVYRMTPALRAAGCELVFTCDEPVEANFDPHRIEQVVVNLLSNAMKYGAHKPVSVHLRREGEAALLSVRDSGVGIAPENQARIFGRFERAISASEISGLGLGLFIVRQIMDLHGGSISVESQLGQGATFIMRLPLNQ